MKLFQTLFRGGLATGLKTKALLLLLASVTVGTVGAGSFSLALFTDQDAIGANAFNTGTISLSTTPTTALVSLSSMVPGDSITGTLVVTNDGTGALRYAMSTTNTDPVLAAGLNLEVRALGTSCAVFDGSVISAAGSLNAVTAGFGSAATGQQTGDRTLAAGANETLCVKVSMPIGAVNALQSLSDVATFTYDAEQTKNN